MSLQDRTLVLKNFDPEKTTKDLITELFIQAGPVKNVVIRPDHAFVEFEDTESVGYSKALLDGVEMFGKKLELQPKARLPAQMKYVRLINDYIAYDRRCKEQQSFQQQQFAFYQQQLHPVAQQFSRHTLPPIAPTTTATTSISTMPTITPRVQVFDHPIVPSGPIYPTPQTSTPHLFNLNPFLQTPQTFMPPNPWAPSQPSSSQSGSTIRRSQSFNDKNTGYSRNFDRNYQMRNSERRRR